MAGSINKVILVGNLGADPTVSNTQAGAKIVNLRVTTEVVLQSFNSVLVMLDSRNGDSAAVAGSDVFAAPSSGWDNSSATTPSDLDDDIPF